MAETAGLTPSSSKCCEVARVVAARDHALDAVLLARDLRDQDVVLVVAGHGDRPCRRARCRRARAPRARSRRRTGRCARAPPRRPRSGRGRTRSRSPRGPCRSARARGSSRPCRLRRSRTYMASRTLPRSGSAAHGRLEHLDRHLRRADGLQPLLARTSARAPGRARAPRRGRPRSGAGRSGRSRGSCCRRRSRRRTRRRARCRPRAARRSRARCPTVNEPPSSSQPCVLAALEQRDRLGVLVEDRDLVALARASTWRSPTRRGPQPTIRTNMRATLRRATSSVGDERSASGAVPRMPSPGRRRGEDHPAGRLLDARSG